jgi:spore coat protein U-like protein
MKKIKLLAGLMAFSAFNMAHAATASAPMQVTATVAPKCTISQQNISFGQLTGASTQSQVISGYTVDCTKNTAYTISWDGGLNVSGSIRRLKHATLNEYLIYSLFMDNVGTLPINGSWPGTGTGVPTNGMPITGYIMNNQNVTPGNYSDTVTATITY